MKIHDVIQGDADWLELRAGKVTASEASALLTPLFKVKDLDDAGPRTYLYEKLAQTKFSREGEEFSTWQTEAGQMLEYEARKWVAVEFDERVKQVGFCEGDDGRCGCSPDGLMGEDGGLELKAPQGTNHVRYLVECVLPKDYAVQVHFSMFVTGRKWWRFCSYSRKFQPFVLKVERDEEKIAKIQEALTAFYAKYDAALAKLTT